MGPAPRLGRASDGTGEDTKFELYGGDLAGIEARLDHVEKLGANLLYLTPFFPAGSTHRYDASSFEHVDPVLGGEATCAAGIATLPGHGPAFHIWRLDG